MNKVGVAAFLTSGRTLKQGQALEQGKLSEAYQEAVGVCELDATSLRILGIESGAFVRIESEYGAVVVKAQFDKNAEPGIVFIPCGPYANAITGSDTAASGMPNFKGIQVEIYRAEEHEFLNIKQLLETPSGGELIG
ncbi:MAG: molybdopterin dinucleotide-binding protein [Candidatus Thorarchaeota archaeon]|nr:molybdopterin dinucleotide-binding protein [Candidatus Thorarchaeota archaeon]